MNRKMKVTFERGERGSGSGRGRGYTGAAGRGDLIGP